MITVSRFLPKNKITLLNHISWEKKKYGKFIGWMQNANKTKYRV